MIYTTNVLEGFNDYEIEIHFTNLNMPYSTMINKVLQSYPKQSFTDNITKGKAIGDFVLQYEETDWQFIRRIASHFNAVLLPEVTESYGRFHFGLPDIGNGHVINSDEYEIVKNIDSYKKRESIGMEENFLQEYTTWDIICSENLLLGEEVTFNGVKCVVAKIQTEIYKEEIRTIYTLGLKRGVRTLYKTNHKIFGMSIPATVKEVQGNNMKVNFSIENNAGGNEKFFTFAIESSSFYCMPEVGSEVHIYFPTNDEKDAIAVHAIRKTGSGAKYASKTQNPDNKSFSHTAGSNMELTPSNMSFASDNGGASNINLAQSGDVIISGTDINFTATEDMELGMREGSGDTPPFRPKSVQISAGEQIEMTKGGSLNVKIVDQTAVQGPLIKFEGSIKDAVPLPDAIANRNKDDAKEIEAINAQAKQMEEQKVQEAKSKVGFGLVAMAIGAIAIVATVATGGAAAFAIAGAIAAVSGAAKVVEGTQDYAKATSSGDFSKSFNFVRDTVFGGNDTLYDLVTYGAVLVAGIGIAIMTGGAATEILKKTGLDMAQDVAFNMIADYADDGKINNGFMDYFKSACTSAGMSGVNCGAMNKFKKMEKVGKLSCKTIGRIRTATDIALEVGTDLATTGDCNLTATCIKKYVGNKLTFSDPVDGATGSLYIPATDVVLPDIHDEFKIERKYESTNPRVGALGKCWTTNFETQLQISGTEANVLCTDGHVETFKYIADEWVNDKGGAEIYTLKREKDYFIFRANQEKRTYQYDSTGKLLKITDKTGNELNLTYVENNIDTLTTFSNYKLFFTYKDNKVIQIKDELGRTVQYKYDGDYLTEVVHVDQGITRYTYDEEGYINSITDQNGQTYTKNFFDKEGRVIRQDFPGDDRCDITYDDSEKEVTFTYKQSKRVERTRFNEDGLVTHVFYEDGTAEEYGYDEYQNRNYEKDRNGNITKREFNIYGNLLKEELPNGLVKEFIYDEEQNLIKEFDNEGKEILNTYDKLGNLIEKKTKISVGKWKTEKFTYDSFGRVLTKTDANNNTIKYEYAIGDSLNEKIGKDSIKVVTGSGYVYEYSYDNVGRNIEIKFYRYL